MLRKRQTIIKFSLIKFIARLQLTMTDSSFHHYKLNLKQVQCCEQGEVICPGQMKDFDKKEW